MNFKRRPQYHFGIDPDEVLLDATNISHLNTQQLEGRIEQPVSRTTFIVLSTVSIVLALVCVVRVAHLQIINGDELYAQSVTNKLDHTTIFAERGSIADRNGELIAWNTAYTTVSTSTIAASTTSRTRSGDFPLREYTDRPGFAHVVGYVNYPQKDAAGFYYQEEYRGVGGVEEAYHDVLHGENGAHLIEETATGEAVTQSIIRPPVAGTDITLTIDAGVQEALHTAIANLANERGFSGGAGALMDVDTGAILALTNYPEFDPQIMTDGEDTEAIEQFLNDDANYFLNRMVSGMYAPGSIMKPYVALGALALGVVDAGKQFLSTGELVVPNRYNPDQPTIFKDWKAHGWVDARRALAVSSNVYFYIVGGGFGDQQGIGIANIEKFVRLFGFGDTTGIDIGSENVGTIPNPEWKAEYFPDDPWRVGDTYNTAIGQYGFQVTPLQVLRGIAAVANDGVLVTPHVVSDAPQSRVQSRVRVDTDVLQIVREGMRQSVNDGGTSQALSVPYVSVAAKTGTAQIGFTKTRVNSSVTGFFPYDDPQYAFVIMMENGPVENLYGAVGAMRATLDWMHINTPQYFE